MRKIYVAVVLLLTLFGLLFVTQCKYIPSRSNGSYPECQKFFSMALSIWLDKHYTNALEHETNAFPNVEGDSTKSLLELSPSFGEKIVGDWTNHYMYVPGLQQNDPDELVLLYKKSKTKISYHAERITRFEAMRRQPKRIVTSPLLPSGCGAEWLSDSEFTNRLNATIEFLKKNNRPYWQSVAKEHTDFMNSITE